MTAEDIRFELNGRPARHSGAPERRLLDILREDHGLTGAKPGCEIGRCGACMAWLDDAPVNACLVMAWQLQGRRVRTIESLAGDARHVPVRDALARCGAVQCGYCSAGMVMTLSWLHAQSPATTRSDAAAALCGNLCRCTGYAGVQRAVDALFPPD